MNKQMLKNINKYNHVKYLLNKYGVENLTGPKNPSKPVLTKSLSGYCSNGAPSSNVG